MAFRNNPGVLNPPRRLITPRGRPEQVRGPRPIHRPGQTMSSATVRRVAAAHAVARRLPVLPLLPASARPYASRAEEPDQLTDYPKLPWVSRQTLPPRGWQDQQMRRNFGETVRILAICWTVLINMGASSTNKTRCCRCGDPTLHRFRRMKR